MRRDASTRKMLRGHMIGFFHDGPKEINKFFDAARINGLLDDVQIVFVGSEGKLTPLEMKALQRHPSLTPRPHVLYNHLVLRRAVSGNDVMEIPELAEIVELVRNWQDKLMLRARTIKDDSIEKASQPSDIANVRDVAMDAEHYREINKEQQQHQEDVGREVDETDATTSPVVQLDSVGVFLQSAGTVVGSVFDDLSSYLEQDAEREAEVDISSKNVDDAANEKSEQMHRKNIKIRRAPQPINEFSHNDELLYGGFWTLFPLQKGLPTTGTLNPQDTRHLVTQFHNLYAQNHNFLFLLANQAQRHAATRGVSLRLKSNPESFKTFERVLANKERYCAKIEAAKADPTSKAARQLLKEVTLFASSAGKVVPWSGEERSQEITKLYALSRRFGSFSAFLTCAPDDVHQNKGLRLSYKAGRPDMFPSVPDKLTEALQGNLPEEETEAFFREHLAAGEDETYTFPFSETFMQTMANMNPVATTLVYEEIADAVFTHLIGVPPSNKRKTMQSERANPKCKGLLGLSRAWHFVTEVNGRKSFHFHAAIVGGLSPTLLADVAGFKRLEEAVCNALDTVYKAYVTPEIHMIDIARKFFRLPVVRQTYFQTTSVSTEEEFNDFEKDAEITAVTCNLHSHAQTCHKGKSGKLGCRMAKPSGHPVEQTRVLAVQLKRKIENAEQHADAQERALDSEDDTVEWKCKCCSEEATDPRLFARTTRAGDSKRKDVLISYELYRPRIETELANTKTLRLILSMETEAALEEFLQGTSAQRVVFQIAEDMELLLAKKSVVPELRKRFASISEEAALSLLQAFHEQIRCRNANIVEYCPALSGTLHCNTAPLLLGAGDTAKAAAMYMCKYMIKDAFELAACLSVLADARKNIHKYASTADDSGTPERTVRHFLHKVLNAGNKELSPTQAAAIVLGIPSSKHSHNFVNAYIWDAISLRAVLQKGGRFLCEAAEGSDDDVSEMPEEKEDEKDDLSESSTEDDADDDFLHTNKKGFCSVFRIPGKDPVAVSQAEHYAYRNQGLLDMNYDEFVISMQLSKVTDNDGQKDTSRHAPGRPANKTYPFLPRHGTAHIFPANKTYPTARLIRVARKSEVRRADLGRCTTTNETTTVIRRSTKHKGP